MKNSNTKIQAPHYGSLIDQVRLADKTDQEPEISLTERLRGSVGLVGLLTTLNPKLFFFYIGVVTEKPPRRVKFP